MNWADMKLTLGSSKLGRAAGAGLWSGDQASVWRAAGGRPGAIRPIAGRHAA